MLDYLFFIWLGKKNLNTNGKKCYMSPEARENRGGRSLGKSGRSGRTEVFRQPSILKIVYLFLFKVGYNKVCF